MLYLYLVKRTDGYNYDEYDSFVCAAQNEQAARETWPGITYPREWNGTAWVWPESHMSISTEWPFPDTLNVTLIGEAMISLLPGVVLASFNAG